VLDGKLVACARDPQLPLKFTVRGMASTFGVQGSQGLNCRWADSDERNLRLADQRAKGRVRKVAERARVLNTGDKETRLLADARGRSSIRRSSPSRSRRCARRFIRIAAPWTTARKVRKSRTTAAVRDRMNRRVDIEFESLGTCKLLVLTAGAPEQLLLRRASARHRPVPARVSSVK
jgi:hypothetical protein